VHAVADEGEVLGAYVGGVAGRGEFESDEVGADEQQDGCEGEKVMEHFVVWSNLDENEMK